MILARLDASRMAECRRTLASMNGLPGTANPRNALLPFAQFERLHFARLLVIDDQTLDDVTLYGLPRREEPVYLALLGDVDGDVPTFLRDLAQRAESGLRTIFSYCAGFSAAEDLLGWMSAHEVSARTNYTNWVGRTVGNVREEAALADAILEYLQRTPSLAQSPARDVHTAVRAFVAEELRAGRLTLTPPAPTPLSWWLRNVVNLIGVPLLLLLFAIPLAIVALAALVRIRSLERTDPELCPRVGAERVALLSVLEDHDVMNPFSAIGSLKPGIVRLATAAFVLWLVDYTTRHIYNRGRLARVHTIHFARWVLLDQGRRLLFCSNYDGSLDSYMDDFINKVAFGLNLVFSNGIGYPATQWLVAGGAKDEQKFKNFLRRHQLPTDVWYNANPGLTAVDLERNGRIRDGLQAELDESGARAWVALL